MKLRDPLRPDSVAGVDAGQRLLNGPQTTGREFRNLSQPSHHIAFDYDVEATMRDGTTLLADVYRPDDDTQTFPALLAVSCYPRQIQNVGAPLGFIEAGVSDFWVPRGYGHVIANVRGTSGSQGTYSWLDEQERHDVADLIDFVADQPWCNGQVGMIGISYFAMTQFAAAVEAPPALKAIFPVAGTADTYEAAWHNGVLSETFISAWIAGVAAMAPHGDKTFRSHVVKELSRITRSRRVHEKFEHLNGESALAAIGKLMRAKYPEQPWDELWYDVTTRHQLHDEYWDERDLAKRLAGCQVPMYLGCDWQNVPLHLPSTFTVWEQVHQSAPTQMGLLGADGLTWPWESLHVEALAWFDHWLKGRDTGIVEGDPVRYWLPGDDSFHTAPTWPPSSMLTDFYLGANGLLATEPANENTSYEYIPRTLTRPKGAPTPPRPSQITWRTPQLREPIDVVGYIELELVAAITASDTNWIATIQDISPTGDVEDITAGWLRATARAVDDDASRPGHPVLPCKELLPVPPGEWVTYRIPLVANARRFNSGHRISLTLSSDDTSTEGPAIMGFHHQPPGQQSINTIRGTSRLRLPVRSDSSGDQ